MGCSFEPLFRMTYAVIRAYLHGIEGFKLEYFPQLIMKKFNVTFFKSIIQVKLKLANKKTS